VSADGPAGAIRIVEITPKVITCPDMAFAFGFDDDF
jgi:hypothetical protein